MQEIRYRTVEAGEVYLLWGINGWAVVPEEMCPTATVVKDLAMYTPMVPEGDAFVIKVQVPSGATLDYGFQIRKKRSGAAIEWAWDGDYRMLPSEDGVAEVKATLVLVRAKNLLNTLDQVMPVRRNRYRFGHLAFNPLVLSGSLVDKKGILREIA